MGSRDCITVNKIDIDSHHSWSLYQKSIAFHTKQKWFKNVSIDHHHHHETYYTQSSCTEDVFVHQATNICINIFVCRPRIYLYMEREIFVHNAFPSLVCCCLLSYCLQRFVPSPSDGGVDNALLALICFVGNQIWKSERLCPAPPDSIKIRSGATLLVPVVPLWCNYHGASLVQI